MKIPLPGGNFIYFGKQNNEIQLTKKSADLVRDEHVSKTEVFLREGGAEKARKPGK